MWNIARTTLESQLSNSTKITKENGPKPATAVSLCWVILLGLPGCGTSLNSQLQSLRSMYDFVFSWILPKPPSFAGSGITQRCEYAQRRSGTLPPNIVFMPTFIVKIEYIQNTQNIQQYVWSEYLFKNKSVQKIEQSPNPSPQPWGPLSNHNPLSQLKILTRINVVMLSLI